jgi:class 3 adenylate cyclase
MCTKGVRFLAEGRRRIATLLAAGVVDGTRLLASGEIQTREALTARRDIFYRLVEEHEGRCFRTTGTSLIAEFANAPDAVRAALAIQQAVLKENDQIPLGERIFIRIGLNVGDVVEYNGDLEGDGVDVAIELQ